MTDPDQSMPIIRIGARFSRLTENHDRVSVTGHRQADDPASAPLIALEMTFLCFN
jgi:hypothetical protein